MAEGDDVWANWGPKGNFAGDEHTDLGGVAMKRLAVGDQVKYFGEPATIESLSRDGQQARITLKNRLITQTVKTKDLTRLGQGVAEQQVNKSVFSTDEIKALNQYLDDVISFHQLDLGYPGLIGKAARQFKIRSTRGFQGEMA